MKKLALATTVAVGLFVGGHAQAADLGSMPSRGPVAYAPPPFTWTGIYSGFYAGYGWADLKAEFEDERIGRLPEPDGFFAGSNIGINWQMGGFLIGLEADFSYGSIEDSVDDIVETDFGGFPGGGGGGFAVGATSELDYFGTVRGRIGLAFGTALIYGTGGFAWGHNDATLDLYLGDFRTRLYDDNMHFGWTAGGGVEWAFTPKWSAKVEYLYLDLGKEDYKFVTGPGVSPVEIDLKVHTVKVGLNYRTDWFGGL